MVVVIWSCENKRVGYNHFTNPSGYFLDRMPTDQRENNIDGRYLVLWLPPNDILALVWRTMPVTSLWCLQRIELCNFRHIVLARMRDFRLQTEFRHSNSSAGVGETGTIPGFIRGIGASPKYLAELRGPKEKRPWRVWAPRTRGQ